MKFEDLAILTAAFFCAFAAARGQESDGCMALRRLQMSGVEITQTELIPAGKTSPPAYPGSPSIGPLPAHCRVEGIMNRLKGVDGQEFGIGFAIALPDHEAWNGDLMMQGGGGGNGLVAYPTGASYAGDQPALSRGFAVASTDTGHKAKTGAFDFSFMRDRQAYLDFAFLANAEVAGIAKQIIARYYAKPAAYSYFVGCSTGGREGMILSQRYPTVFNGIVSGDPAMRTGLSNLAIGKNGLFGPYTTATELDVDKAALHASDPLVEPASVNLSTFSLNGGKLIFFHGDSDPWFSALDTLGYYKSLAAANGGSDRVAQWSRIFLVPGMAHCGGGPSLDHFDMLSAVVDWVEKGAAPDFIVSTGKTFPGRSRPLCAYPQHAQYIGSGDPQDARNFRCQ